MPTPAPPSSAGPTAPLADQLLACDNAFAATAAAALMQDLDAHAHPGTLPLTQQIIGLLGGAAPLRWPVPLRQALADAVTASGLPDDLAAGAVAYAVDKRQGARFDELFVNAGSVHLSPGDPYPVRPGPAQELPGSLSHPAALPHDERDTKYLRFAPPEAETFDIFFHWYSPDLEVLAPARGTIATGHPNLHQAEIGDPGPGRDADTFFGLPNRHADHATWVSRVFAAASDSNVVVFPELILEQPLLDLLVDEWSNLDARQRPRLFLPGSVHRSAGASQINEAEVHVHGLPDPLVVHKQVPFVFDLLTEDIDIPDRRIDVHVIGGWRVVVAICRDALDPQVPPLLAKLGATLTVVPAMSPDLAVFEPLVASVTRNSGVVIVANNPAIWGGNKKGATRHPAQALIGSPLAHPVGPMRNHGAGDTATRGAWIVDLGTGEATPVPI